MLLHLSDNFNDKNMLICLKFQAELNWPITTHHTNEIQENN